ncbi:phosphatidate phosphatase App1 family protein [Ignatzschineria sp. LJL83]
MKKILLITFGLMATVGCSSTLKPDENVLFIPNVAYEVNAREIAVEIDAWVYEKERGRGMTTALMKYLDVTKTDLTPAEYDRLYEMTQLFRVDSERGKELQITLAGKDYALPKTARTGRTSTTIEVEMENPKDSNRLQNNSVISFQMIDPRNAQEDGKDNIEQEAAEKNLITGKAYFSAKSGISIISDIDDTIKDSDVLDTKNLLKQTFIEPFVAVDSMRHWYQRIAKNNRISFHYLSSSPIQLYPALQEFMDQEQFPKGSIHLRESTTWRSVVPMGKASEKHKRQNIEKLLMVYPNRTFVLIGDSGEKDPEIYAEIMKDYPSQIQCIFIRNVTDETMDNERFKTLFANIDSQKWHLFTEPNQVPNKMQKQCFQ